MDNTQFLLLVTKHFSGTILPEENILLQNAITENSHYKEKFFLLQEYCTQHNEEIAHVPSKAFEKILDKIKQQEADRPASAKVLTLWRKIAVACSAAALVGALVWGVYYWLQVLTLWRKIAVACSAAALVGALVWGVYYWLQQERPQPKATAATWQKKDNGIGKKSFIVLDDGTKIWLNEQSTIVYNEAFGKTKREIQLTGEAFFDVAKNEKVPLIIHAGNVDIKVKGTAFNVAAYKESKVIETSLVRGEVEVVNKADDDRSIVLKPNEKIIIPAIEGYNQKNISKSKTDQEERALNSYTIEPLHKEPVSSLVPELSWMDNKVAFYHEPFDRIAEKLERHYKVKIHFDDEYLKQQQFTGFFDKETLEQALNALQYSYNFKYTIVGKDVYIDIK